MSELSAWWNALDDPLLSALIVEAGQASLDVRSAQARVREARARRTVAGAGYYPDATATGRARRTRSSEETGTGSTSELYSAGFDASWEPDSNQADAGWQLLGFLRRSDMDFLQHFLPGQPVEKNGQTSGGATLLRYTTLGRARITAGFDTEIANGSLKEIQASADTGNRPQGRHYDYEAWQYLASPYAQAELPLDERWTLIGRPLPTTFEVEATAGVTLGDGDHEAQVAADELCFGLVAFVGHSV